MIGESYTQCVGVVFILIKLLWCLMHSWGLNCLLSSHLKRREKEETVTYFVSPDLNTVVLLTASGYWWQLNSWLSHQYFGISLLNWIFDELPKQQVFNADTLFFHIHPHKEIHFQVLTMTVSKHCLTTAYYGLEVSVQTLFRSYEWNEFILFICWDSFILLSCRWSAISWYVHPIAHPVKLWVCLSVEA